MKFVEYGAGNKEVIMLLHGGGLSWWNYREAAEKLAEEYRVILPILDGHAGSDSDFTGIEDNAERIIGFIDERFGGEVLMLGGLSLGGQILLEILARRGNICRFALVESALAMPSRCIHSMIRPAFGSAYGLIRRRWFSRLQFRALRMKRMLFEDYYRDSRGISRENMIAFMQANALYALKPAAGDCTAEVHVFVGGKENKMMRKSAEIIRETIKGSALHVLPRMYHGGFSINCAEQYADTVSEMIRKGRKLQ